MIIRKFLAVLGVVLVLGTIGALGAPRWQPEHVPTRVESETLDTRIGSSVTTEPVGTYEIDTHDFQVDLGEVQVPARLTYPVNAPPERPGVLMMHGAGTGRHTSFADQARDLASAGVYVVVPHKRLDPDSVRARAYVRRA